MTLSSLVIILTILLMVSSRMNDLVRYQKEEGGVGGGGWLVAGGDLDVPHALLALDVAAPVELAPTPLRPPLPPGGVAAVAAQQVAPVNSLRTLEDNIL